MACSAGGGGIVVVVVDAITASSPSRSALWSSLLVSSSREPDDVVAAAAATSGGALLFPWFVRFRRRFLAARDIPIVVVGTSNERFNDDSSCFTKPCVSSFAAVFLVGTAVVVVVVVVVAVVVAVVAVVAAVKEEDVVPVPVLVPDAPSTAGWAAAAATKMVR
jgi:hypothetical protein